MKRWWLSMAAVLVLLATVTAISLQRTATDTPAGDTSGLVARVVDERGLPLAGTEVRLSGGETVTADGDGWVTAPLPGGPQLVTAGAEGHLPRTQSVTPGTPTEIRLTSAAEETVSIRFGGDVMFGRRFYDENDDGTGATDCSATAPLPPTTLPSSPRSDRCSRTPTSQSSTSRPR